MRRRLTILLSRLIALLLLQAAAWSQGPITYVPLEAVNDAELQRELASIGGESAQRFVLVLTDAEELEGVVFCLAPESRAGADDRELCRSLARADVLELRGGSFLSWFKTIYPAGRRTHLGQALQDFLRSEKPVIAFGGACEFLSGGVPLPRAELEQALEETRRNPRDLDEHKARVAVGFGPRALLDSDAWEPGAPARLLRSLWRTHVDLGLLFVGEVALRYERERPRLIVLGPGQVLMFDLRRARRGKDFTDGVRLHRMLRGDRWEFGQHAVLPAPERRERLPRPESSAIPAKSEPIESEAAPSGLRLAEWLMQHAAQPSRQRNRRAATTHWSLSWDEGSEVRGSGAFRSALGIPLACRWIQR